MTATALTPSAKTRHWLNICRSQMFAPGEFHKLAALGGDGNDASFEQAFSNLAHSYLRDRAPTLLDHELGFQLLDRNQENTKAVGVFAFKVGSQTLFAPMFFLAGDLKGHELLYLKDQDMFVPLKESWLHYILNRKPRILGNSVSRQTSSLGVMQPELNRLSQSPNKYASVGFPEVQDFLPVYAHLTNGHLKSALEDFESHCRARLNLAQVLKTASMPMLESVVALFQSRPKIAQAFDTWHGMEVLSAAIKEAGVRLRSHSVLDAPVSVVPKYPPMPVGGSVIDAVEKQAADKKPTTKQKVKIITWDQSRVDPAPEGLTEEDAETLLNEHLLIQDARDGEEVSVAYNITTEERLTNPPETGVYMVLTKPGDFEKCLIIVDPHGPDGRKHFCTVIRLEESQRNWGNYPRESVWVAGQVEELIPGGTESWEKFYDALPEVDSLSKGKTHYVLIGPRRTATCPFKVKEAIGGDGTKSYEIDMVHESYRREWMISMGLNRFRATTEHERFDEYDAWRDGCRIHLDAKRGTDLRSNHGEIYIPQGFKILSLAPTKRDAQKDNKDLCCGPYDTEQSSVPPIMPGRLIDATMSIMRKTAELKVSHRGNAYSINDTERLGYKDAVVHLVREHGFRQQLATQLLKEADSAAFQGRAFCCRVKYANPYLTEQGPDAPAIPEPEMGAYNPMGFAGPSQAPYEAEIPVAGMGASQTDPQIYNPSPDNVPEPMDANAVAQAAQTGQKEVFDVSMLSSMLKTVRDDTMVDRYIPDLMKAMDKLGRIIFSFYWHQERFADRYGRQDLPELEDTLRNIFEDLGELVLFLRQKSIEPYPEESLRDLDLQTTAEM